MKASLIAAVTGCLFALGAQARGAGPTAWIAYPDTGRTLCAPIYSDGPGNPTVISRSGASDFSPSIALGENGVAAVAWLGENGNIMFSYLDGQRWASPEVAAPSSGNHRGIPSLAVSGVAVVVWAESAAGGFEDIRYAVRTAGIWSGPHRAHEPNSVPDILPSVFASPEGSFAIVWKSFDGSSYVEKRIGDLSAVPERTDLPADLAAQAVRVGLPPETAIAWRDYDGRGRSIYLKQILDGQERLAAAEEERAARTEPLDTPMETSTPTATETPEGPTATPTATVYPPATPTPTPQHIDIIAFGDSITYGRGSSTNGPRTGYPAILQTILNYNFAPTTFHVYNEGVPGEETADALNRIDSVLDTHPAAIILIMEGTNDMNNNLAGETVQENLKQMAFRARNRGVMPVLTTLIPTVPSILPGQYRLTKNFYARGYVQILARAYGIPCADQWNAFCGTPSWANVLMDWATGNHPNDNGYRYAMSPEWYETIAPYLNPSFKPSGPNIALSESAQIVARGSSQRITYSLVPSNDLTRNAVDCYVALKSPDGKLLFLNSSWQLKGTETPLARGILLNDLPPSAFLPEIPIAMNYPGGTYALYVVTVRCLRDPWDTNAWTGYADIHFQVN